MEKLCISPLVNREIISRSGENSSDALRITISYTRANLLS